MPVVASKFILDNCGGAAAMAYENSLHIDSGTVPQRSTTSHDRIDKTITLFCVLTAVLAGTALRWLVNADEALWYDEVWTGTIAIQDWRGALEILGIDFNAPLFYLSVWGWVQIFGSSDAAIRAPGLIATVAAPCVAWLLLRGRMPLHQRALFTIIVALWIPGLYFAQEARSYPFTVLGAVLETVFFFRALRSKGARGDIAGWALSGLFLGLTHYTTLVMSAVQGITLLILFWRTRLLSVTFAGLAYTVVLAVFLSHYEAFVRITNFEHFWLKPLTFYDLGRALQFLAGDIFVFLLLVCVVGVALLVDAKNTADEGARRGGDALTNVAELWTARLHNAIGSPVFLTAVVSFLGLSLFLCIAVFRPIFMPRLLIPFAPGIFLGLIWIIDAMPSTRLRAGYATVAIFFAGALLWGARSAAEIDKVLTWEHESAILKDAGVSEVFFFLDQGFPTPYPEFLHTKVFGFYFSRVGAEVSVREFVPDFQGYSDPRPHFVRFLSEKPGRGLIWTLFPGPTPDPIPSGSDGMMKRIRERGFSAAYDHKVMEDIEGVTCHATGAAAYPKYVCYSATNRPAPHSERREN
ncbi:MAG: hypothetical protein E5X56_15200 [Mesorhizobium sp.]|nr:MAG: hypothetical protein E5X56_15200 [Mesorhizobium sp.]